MKKRSQKTGDRPARFYIVMPRYLMRGLDYLVRIGVHESKAEAIRAALQQYLAQFEDGEGRELVLGLMHLRQIAAKRGQMESIKAWLIDADGLLEDALIEEDLELIIEIHQAGQRGFEKLPPSYKSFCREFLEASPAWNASIRLYDLKAFWLSEAEQEEGKEAGIDNDAT